MIELNPDLTFHSQYKRFLRVCDEENTVQGEILKDRALSLHFPPELRRGLYHGTPEGQFFVSLAWAQT